MLRFEQNYILGVMSSLGWNWILGGLWSRCLIKFKVRGTAEDLAGLQGVLAEPPGAEKSCSEPSPLTNGSQGQMTSGREAARWPQCTGGGSRLRFPSLTPSAPRLPPQPQAWWSAAWSTQTAGTQVRSGACVGSRQANTRWGTAPSAGPSCLPSSALETLSSSPSWPSCWATVRTSCSLMTIRPTEKVILSTPGSRGFLPASCLRCVPWPRVGTPRPVKHSSCPRAQGSVEGCRLACDEAWTDLHGRGCLW